MEMALMRKFNIDLESFGGMILFIIFVSSLLFSLVVLWIFSLLDQESIRLLADEMMTKPQVLNKLLIAALSASVVSAGLILWVCIVIDFFKKKFKQGEK
jgi:hypothetical protein